MNVSVMVMRTPPHSGILSEKESFFVNLQNHINFSNTSVKDVTCPQKGG